MGINAEKILFDAHMHILSVSDVCLTSYVSFVNANKVGESIATVTAKDYLFSSLTQGGISSISNILAALEETHFGSLKLLENDLLGRYEKQGVSPVFGREGVTLGGRVFDKILICPLVMDFDLPENQQDSYYSTPIRHPASVQAASLLGAIKRYRREYPEGTLIVRPFMGLNPARWSAENIDHMLKTCFKKWSGATKDVLNVWNRARWLPVTEKYPYANAFAGIKLYPPMGFDPWPENPKQREKVELLYSFCASRGIPITTHCDDQGFRMVPLDQSFVITSPERWEPVLKKYPELYLNIAHFGKQYYKGLFFRNRLTNWAAKILELTVQYPHVYTDMSFTGVDKNAWKTVETQLENLPSREREIARKKIFFGSDWPLCLMKIESATAYWRQFIHAPISDELKILFAHENPRAFFLRP